MAYTPNFPFLGIDPGNRGTRDEFSVDLLLCRPVCWAGDMEGPGLRMAPADRGRERTPPGGYGLGNVLCVIGIQEAVAGGGCPIEGRPVPVEVGGCGVSMMVIG